MAKKKWFSDKYRRHVGDRSPLWLFFRNVCLFCWWGRDAILPILPATQADHLHYKMLGFELPWISIIPLHRDTHKTITTLRDIFPRWLVNIPLRLISLAWLVVFWYPWYVGYRVLVGAF